MTSMSDLSRVLIKTLSDNLYSTRRETDFMHRRMNWRFHAPKKTLIAHEIRIFKLKVMEHPLSARKYEKIIKSCRLWSALAFFCGVIALKMVLNISRCFLILIDFLR